MRGPTPNRPTGQNREARPDCSTPAPTENQACADRPRDSNKGSTMAQPLNSNDAKPSPLAPVLQVALRLGGRSGGEDLPDGELLRRFADGDAAACEQLVRRH